MTTTTEANLYKIAGIYDGELVVLDEIERNEDGTINHVHVHTFSKITQGEVDERKNNPDEEIWKECVAADRTTDGLDDWWEDACDEAEMEGLLFPFDDNSFREETHEAINNLPADKKELLEEEWGVLGEDYVAVDCRSMCGRISEMRNHRISSPDEWDVIIDEEIYELVK